VRINCFKVRDHYGSFGSQPVTDIHLNVQVTAKSIGKGGG